MATPFTQDRLLVGYFLAYSTELIPAKLAQDYGVSTLTQATALFYPKLRGASTNGKIEDLEAFHNSILFYRSQCDSYLDSTPRKGHAREAFFKEKELDKMQRRAEAFPVYKKKEKK